MAENFNDYGDYSSELEYQSRSRFRKFFSFRTLGKLIKWLFYALILLVYIVLTVRLIENKAVKRHTDLLWTEADYTAYAEAPDDFPVYSYDVDYEFAYDSTSKESSDGKFSVYGLRYLPKTDELQFTVRFNKSTRKALMDDYGLESLEEMPFRFVLKDAEGKSYENASYTVTVKGRYTYVRIAFSGISLYRAEAFTPDANYPTGEAPAPYYLYKGIGKYEKTDSVSALYLLMYYPKDSEESFGMKIAVFKDSYVLEPYDYRKEKPTAPTAGQITTTK